MLNNHCNQFKPIASTLDRLQPHRIKHKRVGMKDVQQLRVGNKELCKKTTRELREDNTRPRIYELIDIQYDAFYAQNKYY